MSDYPNNVKCFVVERISEKPERWCRVDGNGTPKYPDQAEWPYPSIFGPGALFRDYEGEEHVARFGDRLFRLGDDGLCWTVVLPNESLFQLDMRSSDGGRPFWTRSGIAPNFTLTPSIWLKERWHGYLTNGVLHT